MDIFASTISCGLTNLPVPPAAAAPAEVHKEASEEGRKEKRKAIESKVTASSCVLCVLCVSSVCEDLFPSWNVDDRRASFLLHRWRFASLSVESVSNLNLAQTFHLAHRLEDLIFGQWWVFQESRIERERETEEAFVEYISSCFISWEMTSCCEYNSWWVAGSTRIVTTAASAKDHDDDDGDFGIVLGGTTNALLFLNKIYTQGLSGLLVACLGSLLFLPARLLPKKKCSSTASWLDPTTTRNHIIHQVVRRWRRGWGNFETIWLNFKLVA